MNTEFCYTYRDGGNYKRHGEVILNGTMTPEQYKEIASCCDQGEYFIAPQVGLVSVSTGFKEKYGWNDEDHPWHELWGIREADVKPDDGAPTPDELVARFKAVKYWDEESEGISLNLPQYQKMRIERTPLEKLPLLQNEITENEARELLAHRLKQGA